MTYEWHTIHKAENEVLNDFKKILRSKKQLG